MKATLIVLFPSLASVYSVKLKKGPLRYYDSVLTLIYATISMIKSSNACLTATMSCITMLTTKPGNALLIPLRHPDTSFATFFH